MQTYVPTEQLLQLIDINPPYFAYDGVYKHEDGSVTARVPIEQPLGNEKGPISAAEASRHLAIIGVCSCAFANPVKQRHYYLAYRGIYERVNEPKEGATLYARAECISVDRKKAEALTMLEDENGITVAVLRVYYHVILDTTFERLYKNHFQEHPEFKLTNPYKMAHPLENEYFFGNEVHASMGEVPAYFCAGHFPQYPALPVAILVYNLFRLSALLLDHITDGQNTPCLVRQYEINADNLAFAGSDVQLSVKHISSLSDSSVELFAEGVADGSKSVGKINLVMEGIAENVGKSITKRKQSL